RKPRVLESCRLLTGEADGQAERSNPGHAGPVDPEDYRAAAHARLGHRSAHPPAFQRRASGESRRPLSGAAPPGTAWMDQSSMGRFGKQPPRQVLFTHPCRRKISPPTAGPLGPAFAGDQLRAGELIVSKQQLANSNWQQAIPGGSRVWLIAKC